MAEKELDLDAQKPSSKKLWLLFALIALVLVAGSIGGTLYLAGGKGGEGAALAPPKAIYLPLETLVVNFEEKGPARYMQVDLQVMAQDGAVIKAIETHMPVIRNDLLVLLSSQRFEEITTREGKERLRTEIVAAIQRVLKEQADIEGVQSVFFTNFVMQ